MFGYGYPMYGYQGGCGCGNNDSFGSWWAIIIVIFVIFFVFCGSGRGIGNC